MGDGEDRRFDELSLAQTVEAAAAMRRLTGILVSLEQPNAVVDTMLAQFADWERQLDCVIQQHSCAVGRGSLTISYRRPTPLDTELRFDIARTEGDRGIDAIPRLTLGNRFGQRRTG